VIPVDVVDAKISLAAGSKRPRATAGRFTLVGGAIHRLAIRVAVFGYET